MRGTKHLRKLPPKTPPAKAKQGGVFVSATVLCKQKNPKKNQKFVHKLNKNHQKLKKHGSSTLFSKIFTKRKCSNQ